MYTHDLRETRVYQDAMREGSEKERQKNDRDRLRTIAKLMAMKISAEDIADILGLDVNFVRQEYAKSHHNFREMKSYHQAKAECLHEWIEKGTKTIEGRLKECFEQAFEKGFEAGFENGYEQGIAREQQRNRQGDGKEQ